MKTKTAAKALIAKVKKCVQKGTALDVKVGHLDSHMDFMDIIKICNMILEDEPERKIEDRFGELDTIVRDAFPLTIFDRDGYLVGLNSRNTYNGIA